MKELEILHCSSSSGSDDSMMSTSDTELVWEPPTQLSSLDCWDYSIELDCLTGPEDLHLAAELGKTLLERNKELENCIKKGQCTIDDQAQEIEYLKKQTAAWREANDSRLKIYENLEVNIQDLERANQRLALENTNHKKQIKSQTVTIENLESRLDELQKKFDDISGKYDSLVKEQQEHQQIISKSSDVTDSATYIGVQNSRDGSTQYKAPSPKRMNPEEEAKIQQLINDQDITKLVQQLKDAHYQRAREQKKVEELKDQFEVLIQDLTQKEEELAIWKSKAQDVKNLQDEISTLEEVRQGHLCGRCLRGTDARNQEHLSAMLDQEEEDDELSLAESFAESIAREADANLQEMVTQNVLKVPTQSTKPCLIWRILSCLRHPSTIVCLFYEKLGCFSPLRVVPRILTCLLHPSTIICLFYEKMGCLSPCKMVPRIANTALKPITQPIQIIKKGVPIITNTALRPVFYPFRMVRRTVPTVANILLRPFFNPFTMIKNKFIPVKAFS